MDEITNAAQVANVVIDNDIVKNFADFQEKLSSQFAGNREMFL